MLKGLSPLPKGRSSARVSTPTPKSTSATSATAAETKGEAKTEAKATSSGTATSLHEKSILFLDLDLTGINYNSDGRAYHKHDEKLLSDDKAVLRSVIPHYDELCLLLQKHLDVEVIVVTKGVNKARGIRLVEALGIPIERQHILAFDADAGRLQQHLTYSEKIKLLEVEIKDSLNKNGDRLWGTRSSITDLPAELEAIGITNELFENIASLWERQYPHAEIGKTLHMLLGILQISQRYPGANIKKLFFCDDDLTNVTTAKHFLDFIRSEMFASLVEGNPRLRHLVNMALPPIIPILASVRQKSSKLSSISHTPVVDYLAKLCLGMDEKENFSAAGISVTAADPALVAKTAAAPLSPQFPHSSSTGSMGGDILSSPEITRLKHSVTHSYFLALAPSPPSSQSAASSSTGGGVPSLTELPRLQGMSHSPELDTTTGHADSPRGKKHKVVVRTLTF